MSLRLDVGDAFPSLTLANDRSHTVSIAEVADGHPLILAFYRGPW